MSANSKIQWCDATFNPWFGCRKVASECENCYITDTAPLRTIGMKHGSARKRTSVGYWKQPLQWNNNCLPFVDSWGEPVRQRVFCASLGDWLDDEVPIEWLADLLALIHATPRLDWLLLTKRPENWSGRIHQVFAQDVTFDLDWLSPWLDGKTPANIWIGVSAGADQEAALDIPARIHFLSCEPMLHALDTRHAARFDWVIFGGESGANARRCYLQWIYAGLNFCKANRIAAFVKQLGAQPVWGFPNLQESEVAKLHDSHGGDWNEWPEDLRVREFP